MAKCLKCEEEIRLIGQTEPEDLKYGEFERWVHFHAGAVDRGKTGIRVKVELPWPDRDILDHEALYGRICDRCCHEMFNKGLVQEKPIRE